MGQLFHHGFAIATQDLVHNWGLFLNSQAASGSFSRELIDAQVRAFEETTTQEDWLIASQALTKSDLSELLKNLGMPTLVLHSPEYIQYNTAEATRFAARIPHARLVLLEGNSLFASAEKGLDAIDAFLADLQSADEADITPPSKGQELTSREVQVLHLLAGGSRTGKLQIPWLLAFGLSSDTSRTFTAR